LDFYEMRVNAIAASLAYLGSLLDRLPFAVISSKESSIGNRVAVGSPLPEAEAPSSAPRAHEPLIAKTEVLGRGIFVVHGHDQAVKESVARFLDRVTESGATILHEEADRGRTIIEKFEEHAADAGYAVVLLTGDDEGRKRGGSELFPARSPERHPRTRFLRRTIGSGPGRPSLRGRRPASLRYPGVLTLALDAGGSWKTRLAGEMLDAGVSIDAKRCSEPDAFGRRATRRDGARSLRRRGPRGRGRSCPARSVDGDLIDGRLAPSGT
jgi:hypothetical protein